MPLAFSSLAIDASTFRGVTRQGLIIIAAWTFVAVLFSAIGYVVAFRRGAPQPWWPSFGYALAIFSVWALLTVPVSAFVRRVETRVRGQSRRLVLYAFGLPVACAFHVFTFATLYWPVYNDGGRIPDRWAMGERMLLANLDTNALLYALLVGGFAVAARRGEAEEAARSRESLAASANYALTIRSRGGFVRVPLTAVDRIEAAGDYCEVHAGAATHLIDEPLASLSERLPPDDFARIHRGTIVALDRVVEVRGVGRGDATVRLADGAELRLSRRYRQKFEARLRA